MAGREISKEELQIAEENGISYKTLYSRLQNKDISIYEAITKPPKRRFTAEQLRTAAENGIQQSTLAARVDRGWTIQEAITTKRRAKTEKNKEQQPWNINGIVIHPEEVLKAKANGIKRAALDFRIRVTGLSVEEAISIPPGMKKTVKKRKFTEEEILKAEEKGVSYGVYTKRRRLGWSIEDAINTPVKAAKKFNPKDIQKAKEYGVSYNSFVKRQNEGWSIEETIYTPPRRRRNSKKTEAEVKKRIKENKKNREKDEKKRKQQERALEAKKKKMREEERERKQKLLEKREKDRKNRKTEHLKKLVSYEEETGYHKHHATFKVGKKVMSIGWFKTEKEKVAAENKANGVINGESDPNN